MTKSRIEAIRQIADKVAQSNENSKLLKRLFVSPRNFMDWLVFAQHTIQRAGEKPLGFDLILTALDMISEDDSMPRDAWLVRNLIILRALEEAGSGVSDDLPEPELETALNGGKEN